MKWIKTTILAVCVLASSTLRSQDHYTTSFGIFGGANYSHFRSKDLVDLTPDWKWGGVGGLFVGIPLGNVVTLQPEVLYSQMGAQMNPLNPNSRYNQQMEYLSVPVLFKFQVAKPLALLIGPQVDFLAGSSVHPQTGGNYDNTKSFKSTDFAGTAGLELFPRGRVSIMLRYIYGFPNVIENNSITGELYNEGFQGTLHVRLFGGKHIVPAPPPPPPPPPPADSDGDGITDDQDKCPNQAGLAKYNGCPIPDSDGDGINDEEDKCPNQKGIAKYNGCPIPDSDNDGINDEEDKCPNQPGLAKYNGCPIPDSDGDGINDEEDKCPTIAGVKENNGCPAIPRFNAANVQFQTGSAKLTAGANKALTEVVSYLKKYPEMKLDIGGYTDNTGKPETNLTLSQKRADAVKAYLVKSGIAADHISATGYGIENPIADNSTAEGRKQNRRVEFHFKQ